MTCEQYRESLFHSAAAGTFSADVGIEIVAPPAALQQHLDECLACRSALQRERSLFAAIDTSLRATANAEVPPSFLPRVRARLVEESAPQREWTRPLNFAAAGVALALTIFLIAPPHRSNSNELAKQIPQIPASATKVANAGSRNSAPIAKFVPSKAKNAYVPRHSTSLLSAASSQPEVLVPADEREALARFVSTVEQRSDIAGALLTPSPKKLDKAVTVERLEVAILELKPLEGSETEIFGRGSEQR